MDGVTIQFGLKRGQLRLRLRNGNIPIEFIDTSEFINFQVDLTGGLENNISWVFQTKATQSSVLRGLINKAKLGTVLKSMQQKSVQETVNMAGNRICSVEATFEIISSADFCITEFEFETSNLSPQVVALFENNDKKFKAVVERLIFHHYIQPLFEPYILQAEFDV